ncbi:MULTISPECIES: sugar phosphate isomerase/epimerase family protein [Microbacterium]|uniref:Sugar phosphate isomerase/epimerase n=1 Tax=Microbacterium wangchenii TaxID=2541726 RepID=A0ABX5SRV2_9MICO|nr:MULTISPECIES: sugar phosphate isomerase/epimerase family protein [Microbacterium]MCK6065429.1 sugar phosphate isomerase/epimerase [Microbacterium sp. EYE_512]QBR88861.1 sugar phosphate isomerase/epimerase [Microbacterium wangchenii]TXK20586.1 sugar phosphate isomerase/epimerase [Microbacterium wangchenii]
MIIGAHGLVFTGTFDEAGLRRAIEGTKQAGFDLIEIPLMDAEGFDSALAGRMLRDNDLGVTASLGLTPATDLTSEDPAVVAAGVAMLERCLHHVATMGGDVLCGVIYSAMGKYPAPATSRGIDNSRQAISGLAAKAAERGIRLSLEVVNRYESNVFNTGRGALRFLEGVTGDVSVHLDTYHMNIEESDFFQPVHDVAAAGRLGYVHIGDSHRGYLGTGTVDFATFFRALGDVGYDGPVVFESFSSAVVSAELSNTLGIWRNLWQDSDDLAAHANRYIRDAVHAVQTIDLH